jgi:cytochrome P450
LRVRPTKGLGEERSTFSSGFEYDPFTAAFQQRSHEICRKLRDEHPVYHHAERNFWAISRFEDVRAAALDLDSLTTEGIQEAKALKPMLNFPDPPRHNQLRALVSRAFTFRRVQEMEPRIRSLARELIDGFAGRGGCDLLEEYATPLPGWIRAQPTVPISFDVRDLR